ncbi:DNA adenine methylase [Planktothrix agardhii]|uniref:Site-specific DNA-methyltransferase (adenine-specific) n=1 Tax=Planktothrix agardhii TaxID=1160 RepID=A0AAD1Q192_PLAAG|nr:DNA adenine methylase [Planktothrix agardhii]MCF3607892.1 DNA adenine methylase [Planktothrix agardhii 1033]BBD55096.1 DNA adenine methylase [Planktothrix agardhii NIES-204]MCB8751985.1 DNA adenine methylase [Planktothrix agardhii 1810]MCB8761025.1 DNA adenine methylase [Planktothrix agardhii 1813]MCB8776808.1 DNA adenine methylase [Planktothrix agardhii 1031]
MNAKKNPLVKPFLKWAGGKRQLLPEILKYLPKNIGKTTYFEPFLGGGALLFELQPKQAIVNDSNRELINCYRVIKDNVEELIEVLKVHKAKNSKEYFDYLRERDRLKQYNKFSDIQKAARIIYLNKTCYNGLFRVNSKGQFNVPFGSYKNPNILDEAVLRGVNDYLNQKSVTFLNRDFAEAVKDAKKGDFVYFDPPYDPVSNTASFTGYDINGFNQNEQRRLKQVVDELTEKGCNVMLSNSATDFILDLYKDHKYTIETVSATRSINSNALKRGKINEVLVLNYVPKL